MSDFGTQHAKQEAEPKLHETHRAFSGSFVGGVILLALLVATFVLYPIIKRGRKSATEFSQRIELQKLEQAVARYVKDVGEPPPTLSKANIKRHLENTGRSFHLNDFEHDIEDLDERESVCFWLGGKSWRRESPIPGGGVYFQFSDDYLTDVDGDGWFEYRDGFGNFFVLQDGNVLLYTPSQELVLAEQRNGTENGDGSRAGPIKRD